MSEAKKLEQKKEYRQNCQFREFFFFQLEKVHIEQIRKIKQRTNYGGISARFSNMTKCLGAFVIDSTECLRK